MKGPSLRARLEEAIARARSGEAYQHRPLSPLRKWLVLWRIGLGSYRRSELTRMAAALSYRTIFGLVPTLVVGLVVLHAFVSDAQVKSVVSEVLRFTGLDQISVDEAAVDRERLTSDANGLDVFGWGFGEVGGDKRAMVAAADVSRVPEPETPPEPLQRSARLDVWITSLMSRIDGINFGAVGLLGALMLIYAALSMVVETEKSFNQVCGATLGKSWIRRLKDYWALLTLGPVLLVASFAVRAGVEEVALRALGDGSGRTGASAWLNSASVVTIKFTLSVLVSTGMLMVVFSAVPNKRLRVGPIFAGAVFAAALWELSKSALGLYISHSTRSGYAALYGAVAILPLFLLWVYVTWIVVLLGFSLTSTLEQYQSVSKEGFQRGVLVALGLLKEDAPPSGVRLVDPAAAVLALGVIAQRFMQGERTSVVGLHEAAGIDPPVGRLLLRLLEREGWIARVSPMAAPTGERRVGDADDPPEGTEASDDDAYTLTRPPEAIEAREVLAAAEREGRGGMHTGQIESGLDVISVAKHRALEGKTMADLKPSALMRPTEQALPSASA